MNSGLMNKPDSLWLSGRLFIIFNVRWEMFGNTSSISELVILVLNRDSDFMLDSPYDTSNCCDIRSEERKPLLEISYPFGEGALHNG